MTTICTNCGQTFQSKNKVIIGGDIYGPVCGAKKLGFRDFPHWFKGGNWDKKKAEYDKKQKEWRTKYQQELEWTKECWGLMYKLDKIVYEERQKCPANEWILSFVSSIVSQLDLPCQLSGYLYKEGLDTFEKAKENWSEFGGGTLPICARKAKTLDDLSDKQQEIINRYL